jgi:hypothetical protein
MGLGPQQIVHLTQRNNELVIETASRQEVGQRIVQLLQEGLSGVTWDEIERGREVN